MASYTNFYETIAEAQMRLRGTVILYDSEPFYVIGVASHADNVFRIYLEPLKDGREMVAHNDPHIPCNSHGVDHPHFSSEMDAWMLKNPSSGVLRKMMNSQKFNKFRPFPLGMCNYDGDAVYVERHPTRKVEQGLTQQMLINHRPGLIPSKPFQSHVKLFSKEFRDTILGKYPTPQECLLQLLDPQVANTGAAFSRDFALVRGPIDTLYLAYHGEVIGFLPNFDFTKVKIGSDFVHTKEAIFDLDLFDTVIS